MSDKATLRIGSAVPILSFSRWSKLWSPVTSPNKQYYVAQNSFLPKCYCFLTLTAIKSFHVMLEKRKNASALLLSFLPSHFLPYGLELSLVVFSIITSSYPQTFHCSLDRARWPPVLIDFSCFWHQELSTGNATQKPVRTRPQEPFALVINLATHCSQSAPWLICFHSCNRFMSAASEQNHTRV